MTSSEGSVALREILRAYGENVEGISTHSLKVTLLSWASKANMSIEDRRVLGHHIDPNAVSALTYSRDAMSGPLERLWQVICNVREGKFFPDESRARRTCRALGLIESPAEGEQPGEDQVDDEVCSDSSSDDSDVSEDLSLDEEDNLLADLQGSRTILEHESNVYVHKESGLGHIMDDELGKKFKCGKYLTQAYSSATVVSHTVHMCLRCKPIAN